jgi:Outer membrane protein beta-barrel domain
MKSIHRPATSSPRLKMAALAALMSMAVVAPAQAADSAFDLDQYIRPGTLYASSGIGLLNTGFDCKDPNGQSYPACTRPLIGGKMFGGYRMTPNLAVEVSFYYLGGTEVATDQANVSENYRRTSTRAQAIGFDWANELFQVLNQHIRFGVARVATRNNVGYSNGTTAVQSDVVVAPYVGLGLSYQFNDYVRFYSGFDLLHTKKNGNTQVFWMGLGVEN